jgi:hypothetical protein
MRFLQFTQVNPDHSVSQLVMNLIKKVNAYEGFAIGVAADT